MVKAKKTRQRMMWSGVAFTLVACSVLLAAVNTGTNLLYLVAGGLISFLVLSVWLSRWALRGIYVIRDAPEAVYRGEEFAVGMRIENRKLVMPVVSLRLENETAPGESAGYVLRIPARRAALTRILTVLGRRGVHPLPALRLVTSFPFGLLEARRTVRDATEVLVYPRIHAVGTSVLEQVLGMGDIPKTASASGDEFFSLREYVRGDDIRRIAWRPSARTGSLLVKEMEAAAARTVTIFLDTARTDAPDFEDRFEVAVEAAASLAAALLRRRYSVGLATPSGHVAEAEGTGQVRRILEALARVQPMDADAPELHTLAPAGRRLAGAAVAFSGDQSQWGLWSRTLAVRVLDPREIVGG